MFLKKAGLEKLYIVPYIWQEDREPREKRLWSLPLFLFYFFFYRALNDRCVCSRESVGHMWGCGKAGVIIWHSPNVPFLKMGEMCLKYPSSLLSSLMILSAGKVEEGGRITFQLFWLRFVCVCVWWKMFLWGPLDLQAAWVRRENFFPLEICTHHLT